MSVKIITDSSCDLAAGVKGKYQIDILSIYISDGEKEYKDLIDIKSDDIFEGQKIGKKYTTSQIPSYEYYKKFKELLDEGKEFIYIGLSSGLSGSYNNSVLAIDELKKDYKQNFVSLDSKSASVGLGLIVNHLAVAAAKGASFDELIEFANFLIENIVHLFTVLDLENLYRGGRLSKNAVNVGNFLSLRPLIHMKEGGLKLKELARGEKMAYKNISRSLIKTMKDFGENELIYLVYGDKEEYIEELEAIYSKQVNLKRIVKSQVGCTISIHTGSQFFGNAFLKNKIPEKFVKYC